MGEVDDDCDAIIRYDGIEAVEGSTAAGLLDEARSWDGNQAYGKDEAVTFNAGMARGDALRKGGWYAGDGDDCDEGELLFTVLDDNDWRTRDGEDVTTVTRDGFFSIVGARGDCDDGEGNAHVVNRVQLEVLTWYPLIDDLDEDCDGKEDK